MSDRFAEDLRRQRTDVFLRRVRERGRKAMEEITEAVVESAFRIGRRHEDPVAELTDAVLGSLRAIEREAHLAIERIETLTKEWERDGRDHVVVITRPEAAGRGQPVFPRPRQGAAAAPVPGGGPE